MESTIPYHIPALLRPTVDLLVTDPDGVYVDCTMGGAGHTRAILEKLSAKGRLLGFDQDIDAKVNVPDDPRFIFVNANFRYLYNFLRFYGFEKVNGVLADLGVSFHHFDAGERGFSFREDAYLDMRMNREMPVTAERYVNELSEAELLDCMKKFTDLRKPAALVRHLVEERKRDRIVTTQQLTEVLQPVLNPKSYKQDLAQFFQMLRILVNGEQPALASMLRQCNYLVKEGGRLAVLSYHSGEDRMIKELIKTGSPDAMHEHDFDIYGGCKSPWNRVTKSPIVPDEAEVEANPRSRSAKLRVAERNDNPWPPVKLQY